MCKYDAYIQPSLLAPWRAVGPSCQLPAARCPLPWWPHCRRGAGFRTPDGGSVPRAAGSSPATTVQAKGKKQAWLPQCPLRQTTRAAQGRAEMEPLLRVLRGVISTRCHGPGAGGRQRRAWRYAAYGASGLAGLVSPDVGCPTVEDNWAPVLPLALPACWQRGRARAVRPSAHPDVAPNDSACHLSPSATRNSKNSSRPSHPIIPTAISPSLFAPSPAQFCHA